MKHLVVLLAAAAVMPDLNQLKQMSARFAPVTPKYDTAAALRRRPQGAAQTASKPRASSTTSSWTSSGAAIATLYAKLQKDTTPLGKERLHYFWLNKGPWSDLDGHAAFLPGVPERKPLGANFYPEDMTREEFEAWVKTLSAAEREQAIGFFTVIRRDAHKQTDPRPLQQSLRRRSAKGGRRSCAKPPRSPTTRRSRNS